MGLGASHWNFQTSSWQTVCNLFWRWWSCWSRTWWRMQRNLDQFGVCAV